MERGLVLRQHFFGSDSEEVWSACKVVGEMCNLLAMTYLQQEDFGMVLELLKKAEILTERDDVSKAVTYNNLACYYRRRGKLHAALQYLQKALKIEAKAVRFRSHFRARVLRLPHLTQICCCPSACNEASRNMYSKKIEFVQKSRVWFLARYVTCSFSKQEGRQ